MKGSPQWFEAILLALAALFLIVGLTSSMWRPWTVDADAVGAIRLVLVVTAVGFTGYVGLLRRSGARTDPVLAYLLVPVLLLHAGFTLVHLMRNLTGEIPATWSEQVPSLAAALTGGLSELYAGSNLSEPPFMIANYPPAYYAALKLAGLLMGPTEFAGRGVSAAAIVAMAALLWWLSAPLRRGPVACIAPLLFLSLLPSLGWSSLGRPDFLAVALSLAGVATYLGGRHGGAWRGLLLPGALFGMAILTKQSAVVGAATVSMHLLWRRRYGDLAVLVLAAAGVVLGAYTVLWHATDGGIWAMTVVANVRELGLGRMAGFGFRFLTHPFTVLSVAAGALLLTERGRLDRERFTSLYLGCALLLFAVLVGLPGSSHNYFLEPIVAGSLVTGAFLARSAGGNDTRSLRLVVVVLLVTVGLQLGPQVELATRRYRDRAEEAAIRSTLAALRPGPGEYVLPDVYYTADVLRAGYRPLVLESFVYTLLSDGVGVNHEPLLAFLREGKARYVVLENTLDWHRSLPRGGRYWPREVLEVLEERYRCETLLRRRLDGRLLVLCQPAECEHAGGGLGERPSRC